MYKYEGEKFNKHLIFVNLISLQSLPFTLKGMTTMPISKYCVQGVLKSSEINYVFRHR